MKVIMRKWGDINKMELIEVALDYLILPSKLNRIFGKLTKIRKDINKNRSKRWSRERV